MQSDTFMTEVRQAIQRWRKGRRREVGSAAERAEMTAERWEAIEAGGAEPTLEETWRIASALDLHVSTLLEGT